VLELRPATSVEVSGTSSRIAPAQRLEHNTGNLNNKFRSLQKSSRLTIILLSLEFQNFSLWKRKKTKINFLIKIKS